MSADLNRLLHRLETAERELRRRSSSRKRTDARTLVDLATAEEIAELAPLPEASENGTNFEAMSNFELERTCALLETIIARSGDAPIGVLARHPVEPARLTTPEGGPER
jgi:hypothetical protein